MSAVRARPKARAGHGLFSRFGATARSAMAAARATRRPSSAKPQLEHSIEGTVSSETLIGLLLHHAQMPGDFAEQSAGGGRAVQFSTEWGLMDG
jgi:hypothetical protein